jgi:hypothetical protein
VKKSSRGWNTLRKAFAHFNVRATIFLPPDKDEVHPHLENGDRYDRC